MDKLKRVLSGQDGNTDGTDGTDILEAANQASTLAWGTRVKAFLLCFVLGVTSSVLGSCLLWVPGVGLALFAVLYSLGNLCSLA
uniref:vesicle transport protein SFT2B-like n=1 Tax=Centroberyx gerrardi TaxID=166262 RepID=UPI003AAD7759